jgi:hypothetical protein
MRARLGAFVGRLVLAARNIGRFLKKYGLRIVLWAMLFSCIGGCLFAVLSGGLRAALPALMNQAAPPTGTGTPAPVAAEMPTPTPMPPIVETVVVTDTEVIVLSPNDVFGLDEIGAGGGIAPSYSISETGHITFTLGPNEVGIVSMDTGSISADGVVLEPEEPEMGRLVAMYNATNMTQTVTIATGFNVANDHYNLWPVTYSVSEVPEAFRTAAVQYKLALWQYGDDDVIGTGGEQKPAPNYAIYQLGWGGYSLVDTVTEEELIEFLATYQELAE